MTYDFSAVDELADPSIGLSTEALSALTEFLAEQKEQDDAFLTLRKAAAHQSYQASEAGSEMTNSSAASTSSDDEVDQLSAKLSLSMRIFKEDWQLSQFWYDEETAKIMSEELLSRANGGMIACISAPTVFMYLKNMGVPNPLVLLEKDTRFAVFPEFKLYDYNEPLDVDGLEEHGDLIGAAAAVVLDPPFLNEDCFTKSAETTKAISGPDASVLVSTGWTIRRIVEKTLSAHIVNFRPKHKQLTNAFRCYVNYSSKSPQFALADDPEDGDNDFDV